MVIFGKYFNEESFEEKDSNLNCAIYFIQLFTLVISFALTGYGFSFKDFMIRVLFSQKSIPYVGSIWFLVALFVCEILYKLLDHVLNSYAKVSIGVVLIVIMGHIEGIFGHFLPFEIGAAFIGIGFFHVARGIRKNRKYIPILGKFWGDFICPTCSIYLFTK